MSHKYSDQIDRINNRIARLEATIDRLAARVEARPTVANQAEFLSQNDVCALLQMSRTRLFFLRRDGVFPPPDFEGKRPRWKWATIEAWTKANPRNK